MSQLEEIFESFSKIMTNLKSIQEDSKSLDVKAKSFDVTRALHFIELNELNKLENVLNDE